MRLTDSMKMKPGFRSTNLEVAHKTRDFFPSKHTSFKRDAAPHKDLDFVPERRTERNVSFRRKEFSVDWERGRSRSTVDHQKVRDHRDLVHQMEGLQNHRGRANKPVFESAKDIRAPTATKIRNEISVDSDFSEAQTISQDATHTQSRFTSPPLMPGLLKCLQEILGPSAKPTPIQILSLKWLLNDGTKQSDVNPNWKQFLLASETGSGKSIAYLLPLLQNLKQAELNPSLPFSPPVQLPPQQGPARPLNPRALVLAPTHELARQLSGTAKSLLHEVKMRVLCASRANVRSVKEQDMTARQMVTQFGTSRSSVEDGVGEYDIRRAAFPVDVIVGTPMKLLEMVRGRGWDRREHVPGEEEDLTKLRRGRDKMVGIGKWRSKPELGLANIEWVVVDEADVLFDPDFQETTRQLLADISAARGRPVPFSPSSSLSLSSSASSLPPPAPIQYPFNFILTSATIPTALASYLDTHHPQLMRLASPRLHHLPKGLQTEFVNWTGGNKCADIEHRIRRVWADDALAVTSLDGKVTLSKILIFCNKSSKVDELSKYLDEKGIKSVALSSTSDQRKRGSNHHLDGFLRVREEEVVNAETAPVEDAPVAGPKATPHIMITTSLLSRGLDFAPEIKHVFIVDEPRNMIDFLHRAGRTGRAGQKGKVVVFGKLKGRGSLKALEVRKRVGMLASRR